MNAPSALLSLLLLAGTEVARPLPSDESVILFPTLGWPIQDGAAWEVEIRGWVFEPERRPVTLLALRSALGMGGVRLTPEEQAVFAERARPFLTDNERGRRLAIRLSERTCVLEPSDAAGHFASRLCLTAAEVGAASRREGAGTVLPLRVVTGAHDPRTTTGEVLLIESTGLSVVSDIDDTIKISQVNDRSLLLRNTFLRPFRPVPGMGGVYSFWATNRAAQFHYVTASPWQLYPALAGFIRSNGFPAGTFHMKAFRWKDERFLQLFESPERHKTAVLESLFRQFPGRHFVLVGDAGEQDPEVYGALARQHPNQVVGIFIRELGSDAANGPRYEKAFRGLPREAWRTFREPAEIRDPLPTRGGAAARR